MHIPQTEVILSHEGLELARVSLPPGEFIIGRSPEADLSVETPLLSRQHARLTINYDQLLLEDLGSSNGTFVAGQRLEEAVRLFPNQEIRLGSMVLEVRRQRIGTDHGASLAPAQATLQRLLPPELLGEKRYVIGQQIARGGMGAILDARDGPTQRNVAMKVMLDTAGEGDVLRFIEEAQVTAQLDHPNIVPIYELGVDEQSQPFYTMKMVRGITLKKVIELLGQGLETTLKKYPLLALLTIFQKACDALAFAHAKGVIHRDLKPDNIMLGDFGSVLVMDWGLAKVLGKPAAASAAGQSLPPVAGIRASEGDSGSTMAGSILGTPRYMSPEQARGEVETLDARSDVFALGVILFELLHLRPLVAGEEPFEIVEKMGRGEFDCAPAKKAAPDSLLAVCRKALAFDRAQRYASVEALQRDLTAYQAGFATSAEKAGAWKQIRLLIGRHRAAAAGVAAVLVVGLSLGTQAVLAGHRAEREGARAVAALEALRRQAPALRQLAESEESFQRFDSALEKLDGALALEPGHLPSYWRRAWIFIGLDRWADAAAAARVAQAKDPANARQAAILPLLDRFAAASSDAERWTPGAASELFAHLKAVSAFAEVTRHSARLQSGDKEKLKLVRQRLDEWLGKDRGSVRSDEVGRIKVGFSTIAIDTVEPLKGLPIESLYLAGSRVTSLEPLRGMPMQVLDLRNTKVTDLEPLRGMPLLSLTLNYTAVEDLSALQGMKLQELDLDFLSMRSITVLRGMPLQRLSMRATKIVDLSPLEDAPLEKLNLLDCKNIASAEPLAGLPLKELNLLQSFLPSDLRFVMKMPLEVLRVSSRTTDLSPLRGKTLRVLEIRSPRLSDLVPLEGLSIHELLVDQCPQLRDLTPLLEVRDLEKLAIPRLGKSIEVLRSHPTLKIIGYRELDYQPVAEFWAAYDAQAAGKQ